MPNLFEDIKSSVAVQEGNLFKDVEPAVKPTDNLFKDVQPAKVDSQVNLFEGVKIFDPQANLFEEVETDLAIDRLKEKEGKSTISSNQSIPKQYRSF